MIELHCIEYIALPSNKGMQLTIKSVTPFAFAKGAPLLLAADPQCWTARHRPAAIDPLPPLNRGFSQPGLEAFCPHSRGAGILPRYQLEHGVFECDESYW